MKSLFFGYATRETASCVLINTDNTHAIASTMVHLFRSDQFRLHDTGQHPESAARLIAIDDQLDQSGLANRCQTGVIREASTEEITRVHTADYLDQLQRLDQAGGGRLDADTVTSKHSLRVARLAAGSALVAVDAVMESTDSQALVLARPPGHHALPDTAMGFCLLNHVALAARHAQQAHGLERVVIVDWDVHHGNGTQDIFYADAHVAFLSIHRFPFYPGTGDDDETGSGPGLGTTRNVPVAFGTSREAFRSRFASALESLADQMKPQLILVSAGFDAHALDPIGSLGLESEDFAALTQMVLDVAKVHANGRLVSLLEGGYHPEMLAESVQAHLETLLD